MLEALTELSFVPIDKTATALEIGFDRSASAARPPLRWRSQKLNVNRVCVRVRFMTKVFWSIPSNFRIIAGACGFKPQPLPVKATSDAPPEERAIVREAMNLTKAAGEV